MVVSRTAVIKMCGPKLVPFFKTVAVYFVLFIPEDRASCLAAIVKCLPIASLAMFVLLHGVGLQHQYRYARRVLVGLGFSALGDALLVFPGYFLHGMAAFGAAHCCYTAAFGLRPLNVPAGAALYAAGAASVYLLLPGARGPMVVGLPLYTLALMTMLWRAAARVPLRRSYDLWTWTGMCSLLGAVCFVVSDAIIGFHVFYGTPYVQAAVMVLYYAAQLGIAVSVVDPRACHEEPLTCHHRRNPWCVRAGQSWAEADSDTAQNGVDAADAVLIAHCNGEGVAVKQRAAAAAAVAAQ